jgi:hypothetical protein
MDRTCYRARKLRNHKKNNACKTGREDEERWTKNEMEGWCEECFEELGCG